MEKQKQNRKNIQQKMIFKILIGAVFCFGFFFAVSIQTVNAQSTECCGRPNGASCGTSDGNFWSGSCLNTICDETCQNGWTQIGTKCMLNRHDVDVDWATANGACQSYGTTLPSVADLNAISCSSLNFRPTQEPSWGLVKTSTPYGAGSHYAYHDMGSPIGLTQPASCNAYNSCGALGYSTGSCTNVPFWLDDSRTDYGYVCLKNYNPNGANKPAPSCPIPPRNGSCGGDAGGTFASPPADLCSYGNPSAVSTGWDYDPYLDEDVEIWFWQCAGTNGGRTVGCTAYVAHTPPPPPIFPTVNFFPGSQDINLGNSATISWNTSNAVSCSAYAVSSGGGNWSGGLGTSGSRSVTPTSGGVFYYALSCTSSTNTDRVVLVTVKVDNGCAANTCIGLTCNNGINANAPGTKVCTGNGCEANTCVGLTCNNGINANAPGTKFCDNGCAAITCNTTPCWNNISWVNGTKICADNSCAANTCTTGVCWNNLTWIAGTKLCDNGCAANTCVGLTCNNGINANAPGTKVCDNGCAAITCNTTSCWNNISWINGTKICADNSCAANTCVPGTCWNNLTWIAGKKLCDNGCAANTCVGNTCWNSYATVAGTKAPNYSWSCQSTTTEACALATCGQTITTAVKECFQLSNNSCGINGIVNESNCGGCPDVQETCKACPVKSGNWREVAP